MTNSNYYDIHSHTFFTNTINADMEATRARFCQRIVESGRILDASCGSGRDAAAFTAAGYDVTAFDASAEMVKRAARTSASR